MDTILPSPLCVEWHGEMRHCVLSAVPGLDPMLCERPTVRMYNPNKSSPCLAPPPLLPSFTWDWL